MVRNLNCYPGESDKIKNMIDLFDNNAGLFDFYQKKNLWRGCFASCSVIEKKLLETFDKKYNFFNLLKIITTREYSMAFERLFSLLFLIETKTDVNSCSLFGDIHHYINVRPPYKWSFSYTNFIDSNMGENTPIIKIWSNR